MKPLRATYGAHNNSHTLLTCDDSNLVLPRELEGLTDRPPGDIAHGDIWWPSVGCGPVEEWWCLWWTQPDSTVIRAGMVRSEVILWPREHVQFVEDLSHILSELSGGNTLGPASDEILVQVAEAMLVAQGQAIVVCNNLDVWPSIIAGIWRNLWPAARMEFSARLALSPPQSVRPSSLPWITGVPIRYSQQWQRPYTKVELQAIPSAGTQFNRASWFLSGRTDQIMSEILNEIPPRQSNLDYLTRAARAASNLEKLNKSVSYDNAVALLRTLIVMTTSAKEAVYYKNFSVSIISQLLPSATSEQIESLANLDLSSVSETKELEENLRRKIETLAPQLAVEASVSLLKKLYPGKAQHWWQSIVRATLQHGLNTLNDVWARSAINWLAIHELEEILYSLIRNDQNVESKVLKAAKVKTWKDAELNQLCEQAKKREWSILHAWSLVAKKLSVADAFAEQNCFTGDPVPGYKYLIDTLPVEEVVMTILARDDPKLCGMAAQLTKLKPELLRLIDISKSSSRMLWATHIQLGGQAWPEYFQPSVQGNKLIEVVISGEDSHNIIEAVGMNISHVAAAHTKRHELWGKLSVSESKVLLPLVADILITQINTGQATTQPEHQVVAKIFEIMRTTNASGRMVCTLFSWNTPVSEHEVINWFCQFTRVDWKMVASKIGQAVLAKNWKNAAKKLYDLRQTIPEVMPAVESCKELLPRWECFKLKFDTSSSESYNHQDLTELISQIADIGSELAPDGLDEIWERVGGKMKDLESKGTPRSRWQKATRLAASGAKCNLKNLVRELKNDFPRNGKLKEVEKVLNHLKEGQM